MRKTFGGYQDNFFEYVESAQKITLSVSGGPVHVVYGKPSVYQLWDDAKVIINLSNSGMLVFLQLVGMYKGRGLSPFCCDFKSNYNLRVAVEYFFIEE